MSICRDLLKEKRPSYKIMNSVITQQIGSYLFPCADTTKDKMSVWEGPKIMDKIIEELCQYP